MKIYAFFKRSSKILFTYTVKTRIKKVELDWRFVVIICSSPRGEGELINSPLH